MQRKLRGSILRDPVNSPPARQLDSALTLVHYIVHYIVHYTSRLLDGALDRVRDAADRDGGRPDDARMVGVGLAAPAVL